MILEVGKTYYVSINKKEASPTLLDAFEQIGDKQISVLCKRGNYIKYFKVIDKRLKHFTCFEGTFFLRRFIMKKNLQLEFDFYV